MPQSRLPRLTRLQRALAALFLAAAACLVAFANVQAALGSDPFGTLLVSSALAEHGSIRLETLDIPDLGQRLGYRGFERGGHQYYVYPLGTSLAAVPLVAVARTLGIDVTLPDQELRLQHALVVLSTVALVAVMLRLARRLLPFGPAFLCTAVFWSGTSLTSVAGAALWSHTLAVLLALIVVDLIVASAIGDRPAPFLAVGVALFLAYLCRPTMAVFAALVVAWMATRDWRRAFASAGVVAALLLVLVAFSWREFGTPLPPYYTMGTSGGAFTLAGLAGLLVSPSRGLLLFSPVLLGVWAARPLARRDWPLGRGWWLVAVGWPMILVAALSRWEMWWGGGCFGPRLLTDALPGLFLLTLRVWPVRWPSSTAAWAGVVVLTLTASFSSWVHVAQGLYNPWVQHWNVEPSIDNDAWTRFDWRFPQFLHSGPRHRARLVAYFDRHPPAGDLPPVRLEAALAADNPVFDAIGFDRQRDEGRWTLLQVAELRFIARPRQTPLTDVSVTFGTNGAQHVSIELNDTPLLSHTFDTTMTMVTVPLPADAVRDGVNRLRFITPEARRRGRGDGRHYGIAIKGVMFQ